MSYIIGCSYNIIKKCYSSVITLLAQEWFTLLAQEWFTYFFVKNAFTCVAGTVVLILEFIQGKTAKLTEKKNQI